MKQNIHPKYGEAKVTCACGNSFMSGSVNRNCVLTFALNVIRSSPANSVT